MNVNMNMTRNMVAVVLVASIATLGGWGWGGRAELVELGGQPPASPSPLDGVKAQLKDPAKPFTLLVELRAKKGRGDDLAKAFVEHVRMTRTEAGALRFDLNRDAADPDAFVLYERWADLKSLQGHFESAWMKKVSAAMTEHGDGAPKLRVLLPSAEEAGK